MRFSTQLLVKSAWFWSVIGLSLLANLWTWFAHPECCDRLDRIGFPLPFHLSGGIAGSSDFYPIALTLDILIVFTLAIIAARIGLLFDGRE